MVCIHYTRFHGMNLWRFYLGRLAVYYIIKGLCPGGANVLKIQDQSLYIYYRTLVLKVFKSEYSIKFNTVISQLNYGIHLNYGSVTV